MARGDIVSVDLPAPSGVASHEQVGVRPGLVVQSDATGANTPVIMIVPFTSQLGAARFPHTIRVNPSPQNGLSQPSVLLVFQLRAVDRRRLRNTIGHLEQSLLVQTDMELRGLLDL